MDDKAILARAIEIAQTAHQGQFDEIGERYIEHCRRVARNVLSTDEKTVAYLHDVVEKTRTWPMERLAAEGFPTRILEAVQVLTRAPAESDEDLVLRAASNDLARSVKIADLNDNLMQALLYMVMTIGSLVKSSSQGPRRRSRSAAPVEMSAEDGLAPGSSTGAPRAG